MTWFKVDDAMSDHPDIIQLLGSESGRSAIGLWTIAGSWSAKHLTNGAIPTKLPRHFGFTKRHVSALLRVGLWEETSSGYQFRNWLKYQPSKEQVTAQREATKRRVKRHRNGVTNASVTAPETLPPTRPDPTRPSAGAEGAPRHPPLPDDEPLTLSGCVELYREVSGSTDVPLQTGQWTRADGESAKRMLDWSGGDRGKLRAGLEQLAADPWHETQPMNVWAKRLGLKRAGGGPKLRRPDPEPPAASSWSRNAMDDPDIRARAERLRAQQAAKAGGAAS